MKALILVGGLGWKQQAKKCGVEMSMRRQLYPS